MASQDSWPVEGIPPNQQRLIAQSSSFRLLNSLGGNTITSQGNNMAELQKEQRATQKMMEKAVQDIYSRLKEQEAQFIWGLRFESTRVDNRLVRIEGLLETLEPEFAGVRKSDDIEKMEPLLSLHNSLPNGPHESSRDDTRVMDESAKLEKRLLDLERRFDIFEKFLKEKEDEVHRKMDTNMMKESTHRVISRKQPRHRTDDLVKEESGLDEDGLVDHNDAGSDSGLLSREATERETFLGADFMEVQVTVTDYDIDVESRQKEYRDILRSAEIEFPLESDVWGASTFVILKDFPDVFSGEINQENLMRITIVVLVLVLNLVFQAVMLYYIALYVMLPNVASVQQIYEMYHKVAFSDGKFDETSFQSLGDRRLSICEMGISTSGFLWTCAFLWVARCMNEMRGAYVQKMKLDMIPTLPYGVATTHMVHEVMVRFGEFVKESKNMVVCVNRHTYWCLFLVVFLPRWVVSACLLLMGTAFLTSAQSFNDLLLNTLAMSFIFQIDKLFYEVFLPTRIKQTLQHTKWMTPREEELSHLSTKELDQVDIRRAYRRSAIVLVLVLSATISWFHVQPVIPGFEFDVHKHCQSYLQTLRQVPCSLWETGCFPK